MNIIGRLAPGPLCIKVGKAAMEERDFVFIIKLVIHSIPSSYEGRVNFKNESLSMQP